MRTYKRINEDYLDSVNHSEYTDELSINVDTNVDMLRRGKTPNIDFNVISEPIYKISNRKKLTALINLCMKKYGNDCCLNWIDVSRITDMSGLFYSSKFNGDISKWNVSNVQDMGYMFYNTTFNGDISGWDVSSVKNMECMFSQSMFNGDIS